MSLLTSKLTETKNITVKYVDSERSLAPESLGSRDFKATYGLKYAYLSGGMYKAIASEDLVIRMGRAGYLGFYGTAGCRLSHIEQAIQSIQRTLVGGQPYGMNLVCSPGSPARELSLVQLFLRYGIKVVEAAAFMQVTPALVIYRLSGLRRDANGRVITQNKIIAKMSRPEVAKVFLSPAPQKLLDSLLTSGYINAEQAEMAKEVPMADDLCVESDSGGHTDMGVSATLLPTIVRLRDEMCRYYQYQQVVHVGSSGGIGTPEAAAAAFIMGADFIMTGSVNQCTVEAGTSAEVKDMLQHIGVQDTDYAPAGDMFELGAKIQVMKRGVLFPARANKLYDLWRIHDSLEDIDRSVIKQIEEKYFRRSIDEVYAETKSYYLRVNPEEISEAERRPKHKMALIFRWYFIYSSRLALNGERDQRANYQVHTGPALGAFNQWVKNTAMEDWRCRHVDEIATKIIADTADLLSRTFNKWTESGH